MQKQFQEYIMMYNAERGQAVEFSTDQANTVKPSGVAIILIGDRMQSRKR